MFIRRAISSHHNEKDIYCLRNSWFHLSGSDGLPWQSTSDNNHGNNCTLAAGQQKCTIQEKCYSDLSASVPVLYLSFMRNALIKECFLKSYLHEDCKRRRDVSFTLGGKKTHRGKSSGIYLKLYLLDQWVYIDCFGNLVPSILYTNGLPLGIVTWTVNSRLQLLFMALIQAYK